MSIFGTAKPFICEATATLTVSGTTYSGGYITVTTTGAHGLVTNEYVYISGVATMTDANGLWEITKIDATSFKFLKTTAQGNGTGGSVRVGYKFINSIYEYDLIQPDQLNYRSVINGNKTNTFLGDYGSFKITERLWQNVATFTASLRFQRLNGLYHTNIWVFPHSNPYVMDSSSNPVTCYFRGLKPMYYKNLINYDAVICEIETNKYHDVTKILV